MQSPIKRTNEEWRELLARWQASGLPREEWCEANGINANTFNDRAYRLRRIDQGLTPLPKQAKKQKEQSAGWVQIKSEKLPEKNSGISIEHGGFTVTVTPGFDAVLLTETLRTVKRSCC